MRTFLFTALTLFSIAGPTTVRAQKAEDVFIKHLEAIGGQSNWDRINTLKLTGNMVYGNQKVPLSETIVNHKALRTEFKAMGSTNYQIVTTTAGWSYMPARQDTAPSGMTDEQVKEAQDQLDIEGDEFAFADRTNFTAIRLDGADTANNANCYKLIVTDKKGDESTLYIDMNTYYVVREEWEAPTGTDVVAKKLIMDFSNFRKLSEGITIPMVIHTPQGIIYYTNVEINKRVDDSLFVPGK